MSRANKYEVCCDTKIKWMIYETDEFYSLRINGRLNSFASWRWLYQVNNDRAAALSSKPSSCSGLTGFTWLRCFAVAGSSTWNSLPDSLRDPSLSLSIFRRHLKTHFFAKYWRYVLSALEIFYENALYKFTLHLLTYLRVSCDLSVSCLSLLYVTYGIRLRSRVVVILTCNTFVRCNTIREKKSLESRHYKVEGCYRITEIITPLSPSFIALHNILITVFDRNSWLCLNTGFCPTYHPALSVSNVW